MSLEPKIRVLRALSAHIAKRAITLFWVLDGLLLVLLLIGIWALAHFLSGWWWLLLIIYIPLFIISLLIYFFAVFIASRLYRGKLTRPQRHKLNAFVTKIIALLETRGIGWWWFAALCVRDLVFYQELRTLNELLRTATSLKHDFTELEEIL